MSERLSESEREASYCTRAECHARHVHTPAVEAILAARLAVVLDAVNDPANRWWHTGGTPCVPLRAVLAALDGPGADTQRDDEGSGL
jgi:hypothetical protein